MESLLLSFLLSMANPANMANSAPMAQDNTKAPIYLKKLKIGMTKLELIDGFGKPQKIDNGHWSYHASFCETSPGSCLIILDGDRVIAYHWVKPEFTDEI